MTRLFNWRECPPPVARQRHDMRPVYYGREYHLDLGNGSYVIQEYFPGWRAGKTYWAWRVLLPIALEPAESAKPYLSGEYDPFFHALCGSFDTAEEAFARAEELVCEQHPLLALAVLSTEAKMNTGRKRSKKRRVRVSSAILAWSVYGVMLVPDAIAVVRRSKRPPHKVPMLALPYMTTYCLPDGSSFRIRPYFLGGTKNESLPKGERPVGYELTRVARSGGKQSLRTGTRNFGFHTEDCFKTIAEATNVAEKIVDEEFPLLRLAALARGDGKW